MTKFQAFILYLLLAAAFLAGRALASNPIWSIDPTTYVAGCQYNAVLPTLSDGQYAPLQCDINGKLLTH